MSNFGSTNFSLLGSGISDIFGGFGDMAEKKSYEQAQTYALQDAAFAKEATDIQLEQANRAIYQSGGQQTAALGAAGLSNQSGSAFALMRSNVQQGSLQKSLISLQGRINETGYEAEAASYQGMAKAAGSAGIGGFLGGLAGIAGSIFTSDADLKEDITQVGVREDGIGIFTFRYRNSDTVWLGLMAQDVQRVMPDAVFVDGDGYMAVDYEKVGFVPQQVS